MKSGMDKKNEVDWWKLIRNDELATALDIFPNEKNLEVLELGGRDGFQAELISKKGYKVTSIDINPLSPQFHLVQKGDVTKLNFNEGSFDIIFSSNMIQEIENIEDAFAEMKRVLKKDGLVIHIVPSGWWSLITNFWHYCLIPKYLSKSGKFQQFFNSTANKENAELESSKKNLKRLFFHPLGVNTSFVHEIFHFSEINWIKLFKQNGFQIVDKKNCPYFYSAYSVFRFKFLGFRKFFAKIGFPSCYCFIMKRDTDY